MRKEEYSEDIAHTWENLKDFQKDTVDFVYDKFYGKEKRDKFLVADEVGLGKTIVAKGIISRAYQEFKPNKSNPTFNVIYICSNQALAKENLKKLNFTNDGSVVEDPLNRLVYLALQNKKENGGLKFDSLTPSTSLTISNKSGTKKERAIIYTLLFHFDQFKKCKEGLKWLLKGTVTNSNWTKEIIKYSNYKDFFRKETFKKFRKILLDTKVTSQQLPRLFKYRNSSRPISVWAALLDICSSISEKNDYKSKNEIIVCLRHLLTKVCLEHLGADLIILDEFQRYAEILDCEFNSNPAVELAQAVFELKGTKVLMLSATPFKPYTSIAEQDKDNGESHYREFKRVLKFLMKDKSEDFWDDFEECRRSFFSKISCPQETLTDLVNAEKIKLSLQEKYKSGIVRTERNKVCADQNSLVKSSVSEALPFNVVDIKNYVVLEKLFNELKKIGNFRLPAPVDYCKSSPFPLSFSEGYQFRKNLEEVRSNTGLRKFLEKEKDAWLDLNCINQYNPIGGTATSIVPNAKMQLLLSEVNESGAWKWLWVPPTIAYYRPENIFPINSDFSKTLIFSSWKMVPRSISSIISYEAERLAMQSYFKKNKKNNEKQESYFSDNDDDRKRKPTPLLTFKKRAGKEISAAMSLFTFLYPSKYLIELYDPQANIFEKKTIKEIIDKLSSEIHDKFYKLNLDNLISNEGISERWYWAAPLLLDKEQGFDISSMIFPNDHSEEESTNEQKHVEDFKRYFDDPKIIQLGKVPLDLFDTLAHICLSSPSVCFARSILKLFKDDEDFENVFSYAYSFAIAKKQFFNKPESIAIVKSFYPSGYYWQSVLKYCLDGNLQSSVDEFVHLLAESGSDTEDIKDRYLEILSLRTSTIKVDDFSTFKGARTKKLRAHYAVDFGTQNIQTDAGTGRIINVRQAFNSPYRPFVLASTSIGQEGLDFHYYCGKVVHWNLPTNAIDIEQREGRVNRYKGLIIRQNVVRKYIDALKITNIGLSLWEALFNEAVKIEGKGNNKCELVPYWHIEPIDELKIQRIVPLYPFSKDIQRYKQLTETLTYYRLTFGQPRQEELVETLFESGLSSEEINILRAHLLIDLSP